MITVLNQSTTTIKVAINKWGDSGNTGYFTLNASGGSDRWDRSDSRGFVMSIEKGGGTLSYFVLSDSAIKVSDKEVTDDGKPIQPVSRGA